MKPIQELYCEKASIEQDASPQPSDHRTSALPLGEDNCSNQYSLHDLQSLYFSTQKKFDKNLKSWSSLFWITISESEPEEHWLCSVHLMFYVWKPLLNFGSNQKGGNSSPQKGLKNWIFFVRKSLKLLRNSNEKIILLSTLMDISVRKREKIQKMISSFPRKKCELKSFLNGKFVIWRFASVALHRCPCMKKWALDFKAIIKPSKA